MNFSVHDKELLKKYNAICYKKNLMVSQYMIMNKLKLR